MANEVAQREVPEIVKFRQDIEARANELKMALPEHISAEKFQRTLITAVQQNPELLTASRQSLVLACMKAAQDALLPDGREAALVIFKQNRKVGAQWETTKLVQYMPMVYGLRKKILQSGEVATLECGVVYRAELDAGRFLYEVGSDQPLRYRPSFDLSEDDVADRNIVIAYSIATMKDGTKSFDVMRRFEIDKVRQMSQTGAEGRAVKFGKDAGKPIEAKGPWVDWFAEMAKKTVMRRHSKMLPQSGDLTVDIEGREQESAMSAVRALTSVEPDQPQIEDRSDELPPHDRVTGEILDDEPDKPKRTRRTRAQIDADNNASAADDGEPEPEQDEATGMTKHPGEDAADRLIGTFKAATTVIDLRRAYDGSAVDREAMPEEIALCIDTSFQQELKRLAPNAAAQDLASA